MNVDPRVYQVAELFIADLILEVPREVSPRERDALIERAAAAMQQAIEDEYEAIRREFCDDITQGAAR
jgi:hypothetical protein